MTRSATQQLLLTLIACSLTAGAVIWWQHRSNKKIAVVDAISLFNNYKMKIELEAKAGGQLDALARQADSLKQELSAKSNIKDIPRAELETLYGSFTRAQSNLEQAYQASNQTINEQVWKRLNPLIDEYGKTNGFRLIIGANGMGNVLYNDAYYDQTKEITGFVNKKYEEGN